MAGAQGTNVPAYRNPTTQKAKDFDSYCADLFDRYQGDKAFQKRMDANLKKQFRAGPYGGQEKDVSPSQVHSNAFMTDLSIKYANDEYIGERLLPAIPTSDFSGNIPAFDQRNAVSAPD